MDQALIGLAGIIVGVLLGGTGKYFTQRRDSWIQARASGLLVLADLRALLNAQPTDQVVADTQLGVLTWESHRQVLAGFRRGNYPSGFTASEWLAVALCFANLKVLHSLPQREQSDAWWTTVRGQLGAAELWLARFERDPRVLPYVIRAGVTGHRDRLPHPSAP